MAGLKTLIVEDDPTVRAFMKEVCAGLGHDVSAVARGDEAAVRIEKERFHLVITDVRLPGRSGIEILKLARAKHRATQVVLMTAFPTVEMAVDAMKEGAVDFLQKPFTADIAECVIRGALEKIELKKEIEALSRELPVDRMIGIDTGLRDVNVLIDRVAVGDASVLIRGESGSGKELVAREIHRRSARAAKRLVTLHLPSIPDTLVEAELFGHDKGAFTGALKERTGLLELADGGTIFLDEIGDLSPTTQAKLLRFLQERKFRRVGSNEEIDVNVRVICATHRDLGADVAANRFREDLFYRLNVVPIRVPALRERKTDIPELVEYFISKYASRLGSTVRRAAPSVLEAYTGYSWPGNVRELENVVSRALALTQGDELKLVYPQAGAEPERYAGLAFRHFFLQPMDGPEQARNTRLAIDYCLAHPRWRLSLQTHKLIGIR